MKYIIKVLALLFILNSQIVYAENNSDKALKAYEKGEKFYQDKNYNEALEWLLKSYKLEEDGNVANNIGIIYEAKKKYNKSIAWYVIAYNKGNSAGGGNLALLYENIKHNIVDAKIWYLKAIKENHINSRKNLGLLYHKEKNNLNSATYMISMIGHPYTKERVLGLLRDDWKIDEVTLKEAYELQKNLVPNPYTGGIN